MWLQVFRPSVDVFTYISRRVMDKRNKENQNSALMIISVG